MNGPSTDVARRVVVTVAVLAALSATRHVALPGLDPAALADLGGDVSALSIGVLGPMTWFTSVLFVEIGALFRPAWRRLRVGGPAERARLEKATGYVWVFVAQAQTLAIAVSLEQMGTYAAPAVPEPGWPFRLIAMATMTAGSGLFVLGARIIGAQGFGNGFAVLVAAMLVGETIPQLGLDLLLDGAHRGYFAPVVLLAAGVAYGVWRLPRLWSPDGRVPRLSTGLQAGILACTWPALLPTLFGMEPLAMPAWVAAVVVLALGNALLQGLLFHLPWNVAPVAGCTEDEALAALRATAAPVRRRRGLGGARHGRQLVRRRRHGRVRLRDRRGARV